MRRHYLIKLCANNMRQGVIFLLFSIVSGRDDDGAKKTNSDHFESFAKK